jgi:hypothetical protein
MDPNLIAQMLGGKKWLGHSDPFPFIPIHSQSIQSHSQFIRSHSKPFAAIRMPWNEFFPLAQMTLAKRGNASFD